MRNNLVLFLVLFSLIFFLLFLAIDISLSNEKTFSVVIIDKHFSSSINTVGTSVGSDGSVHVVNQSEPEKFTLIVKDSIGNIFTVDVCPEFYYSKNIGDESNCTQGIGYMSSIAWYSKLF